MKTCIIIEDEAIAAARLGRMVKEILPDMQVVETLGSVASAISWLQKNTFQGLIFMDISLGDGICFDILEQVELRNPVIFTTAYQEYLQRAFEAHAIAYLLKPIKKEELTNALTKWNGLEELYSSQNYQELSQHVLAKKENYMKRLLVKIGLAFRILPIEEIAYFHTQNKSVYACLYSGKQYPIDYTLDDLEELLSPKHFFRINRQFIVSPSAVTQMFIYTKSRLKLALDPVCEAEAIVAYEKTAAFKQWLMVGN